MPPGIPGEQQFAKVAWLTGGLFLSVDFLQWAENLWKGLRKVPAAQWNCAHGMTMLFLVLGK